MNPRMLDESSWNTYLSKNHGDFVGVYQAVQYKISPTAMGIYSCFVLESAGGDQQDDGY